MFLSWCEHTEFTRCVHQCLKQVMPDEYIIQISMQHICSSRLAEAQKHEKRLIKEVRIHHKKERFFLLIRFVQKTQITVVYHIYVPPVPNGLIWISHKSYMQIMVMNHTKLMYTHINPSIFCNQLTSIIPLWAVSWKDRSWGVSINSYGFKNPNNVRIWVGGWVTAKWVFGFKNPLVKKIQDQHIFLLWMFGSLGGWVGHIKSEHCSDF